MRLPSFLVVFPSFGGIFPSFWGIFRLFQPGSAAFRVVGPGRPLPAAVGSDVVLPCRLSPKSDARPLEIRWIRHQFSETVHHYRAGEDQYGEQLHDYKGRTELVRDGLADGDINLRIAHVRPSDDGQYVCTVENGPNYQEATVELEVTAVGSVPHLSLESYEDGGIRMLCRSAGWYPQPEVLWRDPSGHHLPAVSQRRSPDQSGLFAIEDAIVVTKNGSGSGTWSCTVRNSRFHQEQESSLHISAPFFDDARPFMAALGVFLVLSLALTGLSAYLYRRKLIQTRQLGESFPPQKPPKIAEIPPKKHPSPPKLSPYGEGFGAGASQVQTQPPCDQEALVPLPQNLGVPLMCRVPQNDGFLVFFRRTNRGTGVEEISASSESRRGDAGHRHGPRQPGPVQRPAQRPLGELKAQPT